MEDEDFNYNTFLKSVKEIFKKCFASSTKTNRFFHAKTNSNKNVLMSASDTGIGAVMFYFYNYTLNPDEYFADFKNKYSLEKKKGGDIYSHLISSICKGYSLASSNNEKNIYHLKKEGSSDYFNINSISISESNLFSLTDLLKYVMDYLSNFCMECD